MSLWLLVWTAAACPWPLKRLPAKAQAVFCEQMAQPQVFDRREDAENKLRALGPGPSPRLFEVPPDGPLVEKKVRWSSVAVIEP